MAVGAVHLMLKGRWEEKGGRSSKLNDMAHIGTTRAGSPDLLHGPLRTAANPDLDVIVLGTEPQLASTISGHLEDGERVRVQDEGDLQVPAQGRGAEYSVVHGHLMGLSHHLAAHLAADGGDRGGARSRPVMKVRPSGR